MKNLAWNCFLCALLPASACVAIGQSFAAADPKAVVVAGHARFTVLTPQMVRMEWSADGAFEDRASTVFVNRKLPVPEFTQTKAADGVRIHTSALDLTYAPVGDGKFTETSLTVAMTLNGKAILWHPGMVDAGNLQGTTRTLDGATGGKTKEPMDPGLISRDGWTVVDDSTRPLFDSDDFNFKGGEKSEWPWVAARSAGDRQDLYFFGYGHDYKAALADYVKVAGRIPLPPRFAFGSWWSRYWSYSDQEFDRLVDDFKKYDVPLDVLVIDMGWHPTFGNGHLEKDQSGNGKGWTGYTWNKLLFPQPKEFLDKIHSEGVKTTLNLHPAGGVEPWEDAYPAMAKAMGIDPATQKYVSFEPTDKRFATNYFDLLHHPLEQQGIDFWWLDWQQAKTLPIANLNVTWWLNYLHFTDQQREGKRPMLFHRWGGLGNHRYQIGFSGDTVSVWDSLAFQPWFTATAANVGYAYWSHDIGGHMPGIVGPELYTRWVQWGAFSPILRTHTTASPDAERRIWAYPEPYSDTMRNAFQLRYALQPYLYTEARRTYDTGVAFLHPLYYDWPEADEAYTSKNEYVFGGQMIVDPVVQPADPATSLASEDVWLPTGEWVEWMTGKKFVGPTTVKRNFSIEQIPIYVKAGAVVPMMPKMEYTGEKPVDPLIVNVLPLADGQRSSYTVYEDSGIAEKYKDGECAWTDLDATRKGNALDVVMQPVKGKYPGMLTTRGMEVRLPGDWPPVRVLVNGVPLQHEKDSGKAGWRFDGNTLTTIVTVPKRPVTERITVRLERSTELEAKAAELDGFAGKMARYFDAGDVIDHAGMATHAPDPLIELLQMGDRLTYRPETAEAELAKLPGLYTAATAATQKLLDSAEKAPLSKALKPAQDGSVPEVDPVIHRREYLRRAMALLTDAAPGQ